MTKRREVSIYLIAHLGFGIASIGALWRRVPIYPLMVGSILPDLLDKPLFLLARFLKLESLQFYISGTRTVGHTGLFFISLLLMSFCLKNRTLVALALGVLTHLALDAFGAAETGTSRNGEIHILLWPLFGHEFPEAAPSILVEEWKTFTEPIHLTAELLGLAVLLVWYFIRHRRSLNPPQF